MATITECVSAAGKAIPPLVIYKGKQHQQSWYKDVENGEVFFAVSKHGWTNSSLTLEWLQQDFDPYTKSQA